MPPRQPSELNAATQEKITDLFDNEAIWDADDTDGYIVQLFQELEAAGATIVTLKDQGWNSLLHTASLWNRPKIMEELIRRGAPLNEKNKNGHTPLDLAMHWGHFDLGQQLQHYGGKHTCEKERDIAISQRDLAQQQLSNCELEYEHAVRSLKQAKQEREQLRIERDRLVVLRAQVVEDCTALSKQVEEFRSATASFSKERDTLHIQAAQLQNELVCEKTARNNAVQSWKVAEKVIAELQQVQEECREREEEALRLRNEAIQDRDVARERAKEAQLDQGIAKQNQLEVERERDQAIERLLAGEAEIAHDMEKWRKRIAKTELERRNIQIEIDRQTELLRCENARLEKTVATLTVANTRQRADGKKSRSSSP
ncbi:Nucleoprotein TPR [Phytophthora cinnamomi]|uniref:Nucleoprotein TPR n=1 Tax=Phytophthora cinnamomi TaxID=4785 RepID=UPI00355A9609|nr:Nucleoprotein TPR [Phytophthora cinnamomi]